MDTQDKDFMAKFLLILGILLIFTVVVFMIARLLSVMGSPAPDSEDTVQKARMELMHDRLGKVGSVDTFDPNAAAVVRTGKEISDNTCNSCHGTGVLDAPKLGDAAAWTPRVAGGLDALVTSAINGKGSMPPRGGDGTLTDAEVRDAVVHMLKESGVEAGGGDTAAAEAPAAEAAAEAPAAKAPAAEAVVEKVEAKVENVAEAVADTAKAATETVVDASKVAVAGAVAAGGAVVAAVTGGEETAAAESAAPAAEAAPKAAGDPAALEKGKTIYKTACFACHDTGVANAPKLGDAATWQPRIDAGIETLYSSSINGKGGMPPKGGRLDLNDDDIKSVVDYMVSEVK